MRNLIQLILTLGIVLLASCRHDELVTYMDDQDTHRPSAQRDELLGLYVLNEGNMGSNKCTLDYLDLSGKDSTLHYYRNIYAERNPSTVKELGDVGNDIGIYGSKLWIVVNCSNKVEVCNALTARRLGQVNIDNCRYLAFDGGYAYVSSYAGPVQVDENCPLGRVYKVDTLTLEKVDSVIVGYQPEEMCVADGKLYVANSGGYRVPKYDNRVMEIDLATFSVTREIEVAANLHRLAADRQGQLWLSSRGDYFGTPSALYCLRDGKVVNRLDVAVSSMTLVGDSLYCIGSSFSYGEGAFTKSFGIVDVAQRALVDTDIFSAPEISAMTQPYGIVVNPIGRDFYLMDAKNFVSSGELLHFTADGRFDYRVWTGDIPTRGVFVWRRE